LLWAASLNRLPWPGRHAGKEALASDPREAAARRFCGAAQGVTFLAPVVIGNAAHAGLIVEQRDKVAPPQAAILEPEGRNTAATALLAALIAHEIAPEALVFLAPADHIIADAAGSWRQVRAPPGSTAQPKPVAPKSSPL